MTPEKSGLIPNDFIDEIINRADILSYVSQTATLKSYNNNSYKGLCPFHQEKTPSFHIHRDKQYFHCFGCGEHGNVINFLMKIRNLTFPETIKILAEDLNLQMPSDINKDKNQYKKAYKLLDSYRENCETNLRNHKHAYQYFINRGLSEQTIKTFGLGFSPNNISFHREDYELMVSIGLIKTSNQAYFRNRIMFPITNSVGKVIGFGGRAIDNTMPKYLNSKESFIFHKSQILYGLHQAKQYKPEYLIVVEGYMDVIALHEHGIKNAVATLGTAITAAHINTLFKHTRKLAFCFDGDHAGQAAAWKTMTQALSIMGDGHEIKFIILPESDDPDSLINQKGKNAWREIFNNGLEFSDFFFKHLQLKFSTNSLEKKALFASEGKKLLALMPNSICKQLMFEKLEQLIGTKINVEKSAATPKKQELSYLEKILKLIIHNPQIIFDISVPKFITNSNDILCKNILCVIEFISHKNSRSLASLLAGSQEHELHTTISKYAKMPFDVIEGDNLLINLTNLLLKAELGTIHEKITNIIANDNGERTQIKELLQRKSAILYKLNKQREQDNEQL